MSSFQVVLARSQARFHPFEVLEGHAEWDLSDAADSLELRLYWTTDAPSGSEKPVVLRTETIERPGAQGRRPFRIELPAGPWSFEGRLFTVKWYLELCANEDYTERVEFVLSPLDQALRTRDSESDDDLTA